MPARSITRRHFFAGALTTGAGVAFGYAGTAVAGEARGTPAGHDVFAHSVASGDPWPDSVILWTRVTPTPDATPGSGGGEVTGVRWDISTDPEFTGVVRFGEVTTGAGQDHTVKIEATGLDAATVYHYRFTVLDGPSAGAVSRTGRTRTAPAQAAEPANVRFGVCSCSNYEAGYFRGYRALAERDDVEFVLHLGDYTYEYDSGEYGAAYGTIVRTVEPAQRTTTLDGYRIRQGHYRRDPDLADLHAAKPMICIWDDHEFFDNAWRDGATGDSEYGGPEEYAAVRAAANQAYDEWMPVRTGPGTVRRSLRYGTLMELILPDLRTYRDIQGPLYTVADEDRTMMGRSQFDWFAGALSSSETTWQLVGNSVMFAPMTLPNTLDPRLHDWLVDQLGLPPEGAALNADQWDGYMVERRRIIDLIVARHAAGRPMNTVFLTGDIHSSWASDIPVDAGDYRLGRDQAVAAAEFVVPSITAASAFDTIAPGEEFAPAVNEALRTGERALGEVDPWFRYVDLTRHGMMVVDVDPGRTHVDWFHGGVLSPDDSVSYTTSFQSLAGDPGARPADGELDRSAGVY